jgi:hypothetical protein
MEFPAQKYRQLLMLMLAAFEALGVVDAATSAAEANSASSSYCVISSLVM